MSTRVYFISDIHLHCYSCESETRKKAYLFDFLKEVQTHRGTLYIVGDMFDFWFEYKNVIPRHFFKVLRHLQEIVEAGCEVHILAGNHDFWFESFFQKELGIQVHLAPVETTIDGKTFFITHADGILKRDRGYRLMKKFLRSRILIRLFRLLHPDIAFRIARYVSSKSRHLTLRDPDLIEEERRELLAYGKKMVDAGHDFVITGHFHLPTDHRFPNGKLINLGDWIRYFTFGFFDGNEMSLCYWNRDSLKSSL
jgi:UDP-2,3-diacylglucosamine hydrolase